MTSKTLNLALLGYGKMGQMVESVAKERGHTISSIISSDSPLTNLDRSEVWIDFSTAKAVLPHVHEAGKLRKNIVIGTTGWEAHLDEVKMWVRHFQIGALYAPNFSIGVYLFSKIVSEASRLLYPARAYDPALFECHHRMKQDAPSGTALALGKAILEKWPSKSQLVHNPVAAKEEALPVTSLRVGHVPGIHQVFFDSPSDRITCTHESFNRRAFAEGAVSAAEWLKGKEGFFTLEDMLG